MNDIVPVGATPPNLLFEPTETVNARTISLQSEVDRLHRSRRGLMVWLFILFLLFVISAVAGVTYGVFNQSTASANEQELTAAIEARDLAIQEKEDAERQEGALRDQAQELYEYARVAELQFQVNDERRRLDELKVALNRLPSLSGLDQSKTVDLEINEAGWTVELQEQALTAELADIEGAIELIDQWLVRSAQDTVTVPKRRCNPFKRTDADCV